MKPAQPSAKPASKPAVAHGYDGYYDPADVAACMTQPDAWMTLSFLPCFEEDDGAITRSALKHFQQLHPAGAALAEQIYSKRGAIREGR